MVISLFGKTAICGKAVIGRKAQKSRLGLKGISSLNAQRTDVKKVKIGWCKVMDEKDIAEQAYNKGFEEGMKKAAQEIFKKVYGYTEKNEVAMRYLIRTLASEYGVELPKMPRKGLNGFEVKK